MSQPQAICRKEATHAEKGGNGLGGTNIDIELSCPMIKFLMWPTIKYFDGPTIFDPKYFSGRLNFSNQLETEEVQNWCWVEPGFTAKVVILFSFPFLPFFVFFVAFFLLVIPSFCVLFSRGYIPGVFLAFYVRSGKPFVRRSPVLCSRNLLPSSMSHFRFHLFVLIYR